ncbi:phosphoesterase RecJ-like protein [Motilibacter peucedani]|uniref:Phosphoesterase RecJ-like protein n=1 Tax=Motilibacter peucedani TaxID=598650 RepID=A0A420XRG8_9ACTN|nr:DHHA1 domain-containing protein [Motilibacter peucedani]RKS77397.1 phosphoesterase RecJ-like protein [Motilibacter peucedani]
MSAAGTAATLDAALDDVAALLLHPAGPVVLAAHVAPDGDALGSSLAVAHALRSLDIEAVVSWGEEPFAVPRSLRVLPGWDAEFVVPPSRVPRAPGVLAAFDLASRGRLGLLEPLLDTAQAVTALDHHASHVPFAQVTALDPSAPATAVLAAALVDRLAVPLDPTIAGCLWVGLVTDTGSFRHPSTTPASLRLAARLVEAGAEAAALSRAVLDDVPVAFLPVLGAALCRARIAPGALDGHGLVTTWVPAVERRAAGLAVEDLAPVVDAVRRAAEIDTAGVLLEDDAGAWRLSLRSKGAVDVSAVAVALGGGGHRMAAGATLPGSLEQALEAVLDALAGVPTDEVA